MFFVLIYQFFVSFKGYDVEGAPNGIIRSFNRRLSLRFQGNDYVKHSIYNGRMYWRCRFHQRGCRVRVLTRYIDGHLMTYSINNNIFHAHNWFHRKAILKPYFHTQKKDLINLHRLWRILGKMYIYHTCDNIYHSCFLCASF